MEGVLLTALGVDAVTSGRPIDAEEELRWRLSGAGCDGAGSDDGSEGSRGCIFCWEVDDVLLATDEEWARRAFSSRVSRLTYILCISLRNVAKRMKFRGSEFRYSTYNCFLFLLELHM